ncbi:myosin-binding protein 7-like [Zingiber officinale]|uniref:myosin-binding protein 7-like n=1 Tax=Zingiber officinale TaxID=94328 RepID=UPI001C4DA53C|nr:myosin-binding protein 7-like [Zingiber officinale]
MDVQHLHLPGPSAAGRVCPCACPFCCRPTSPSWRRSMKRRLELDSSDNGGGEVENEADALREALASQQETIQELCAELDEERNAAASAASEAMSMILRLQREKAEAQMDARQFKLFAEEKMEHDQQELLDLEELILKREEGIQGLALQLQAYRELLISHGIDPDDVDDDTALSGVSQFEEMHTVEYPPLKCNLPNDVDDAANLEEIAFGETPDADEDLDSLETRIYELETSPNLLDEAHEIATVGSSEDCFDTQREKCKRRGTDGGMEGGTPDIWNLCMRLQALEADRDSMRQTIISMRTEKAQLVLLRELAQQLHKDLFLPERRIANKNSSSASFSLVAQLEWLMTFLLWRKKPSRTRYALGSSNANVGLLLVLENSPRISDRRFCCTRIAGLENHDSATISTGAGLAPWGYVGDGIPKPVIASRLAGDALVAGMRRTAIDRAEVDKCPTSERIGDHPSRLEIGLHGRRLCLSRLCGSSDVRHGWRTTEKTLRRGNTKHSAL